MTEEGLVTADLSKWLVSKNTSPSILEISEQFGEWVLGMVKIPNCWQFVGGAGGRKGEPDGVEFAGELVGVLIITESLWMGIKSSFFSLSESWRAKRFSERWPSLWDLWLVRFSLVIRPSALDRWLTESNSWKLESLQDLLLLQVWLLLLALASERSVSCLAEEGSRMFPAHFSGQLRRGRSTKQRDWTLASGSRRKSSSTRYSDFNVETAQ